MKATVDRFADAKVGDLVWRIAGNEIVYDEGRECKGRGAWYLEPVTKIARKYVTVGLGHEFELGTGIARTVNGFQPPDHAYGEIEKWAQVNGPTIRRMASNCRDPNILIRLGAAFGIPGPVSGEFLGETPEKWSERLDSNQRPLTPQESPDA